MRPRPGSSEGGRIPSPLDRPFHVALAAFAAGLAFARSGPVLVAAAAACLPWLLIRFRAARLCTLAASLALAGATVGELRLKTIDRPSTRVRDGEGVRLRAYLLTAPRPGRFGSSAEIAVTSGPLRGSRLLLRIPRWAPLPAAARPGAELALVGRSARLRAGADGSAKGEGRSGERSAGGRYGGDGSAKGDGGSGEGSAGGRSGGDGSAKGGGSSFDFAAYLRRRGIAGELFLDRARLTGRTRRGLAGLLDRVRSRAERAVAAGIAPEEAALLLGMVLGQDEGIGEAVRDDFRASGLAHLLAVSGQNVMLLAGLALPLLMLAGTGLRTRLVVLAALIAVYVPLAGAGPSLQRAGVMGLAGVAAMAASRPASRWYALLLAAAATLAWNPRAWEDPGWQLSFAAVVGILALGAPLQRALRRTADELLPGAARPTRWLASGLADGIAITVAATVATGPLLAHHFDSVPVVGLPANLLALPAVAPAMWLGMLRIGLGQLAGFGPADTAAAALGVVAAVPVAFIAWLAERFADLPGGQLALPFRSPPALLAGYAVVAALALGLRGAVGSLAPRLLEAAARWRRLPRGQRAACAALVVAVLVLVGTTALGTRQPPDRFKVRFLDVGQGDATLIQHPDGTAVLFDAGPPEAGTARLLRRAGVRRLALVVATHVSRDHHGGLIEVLRRFPVDTLLDGGDGTTDPAFRAVLREAEARGVRRVAAVAPLYLELAHGGLRIRILSPPPRPPGPPPEDPNPRGVVAIVSAGDFDLLLSADAESEALLPLELPDVEAMKVPHHGSSDPGLPEVLEAIHPELAAIEVGPNTYGHPHPSTLRALRHANVTTYRTDHDGTVTLTVEGDAMRVQTER